MAKKCRLFYKNVSYNEWKNIILKEYENRIDKYYFSMLYFIQANYERISLMNLWDEVYFEITVQGPKAELKKFVSFLLSDEIGDFFEPSADYIIYDDGFDGTAEDGETSIIFTNDDYPVELDEFDTDEFLELICKVGKNLDMYGTLADEGGRETQFTSKAGDSSFVNSRSVGSFGNGNEEEEDF